MTFERIAAELGLSRRTVVRLLESALAKLRAGLDPDLDAETFSGEVSAHCEIARPFSPIAIDGDQHAPRRAGLLPRRFRPRRDP